ncbi:unnamed protein product [Discula destructiva]
MFVHIPESLAASPPIIVAMHGCLTSAAYLYNRTRLPMYADQYGFVLIYPQTQNQNRCWDINTPASLSRNNGGDSEGIVQMVQYALTTYNGDPTNVFVLGSSSGGMMTNVLAGTYPDVFKAAAVFSGVPLGCMFGQDEASPLSTNQTCAQGGHNKTAEEWGDFARNAYPGGYRGARTRMQLWHGSADNLVRPALLDMELAQWSNVMGLNLTNPVRGTPSPEYTKLIYGTDDQQLVGYIGQDVGHPVPVQETPMLEFFGIL